MRQYESEAERFAREQAERDADRETEAANAYADRWANLTLDHQTEVDPTLDHQVVFYSEQRGSTLHVSCNCRAVRPHKHGAGVDKYVSIRQTHNLDEAREAYNDPANHNKPFTEADRARW